MARKTKKLNNAKYLDIMSVLDDLKKDDTLFRCDYSQIAKHLLKKYLPIKNIWSSDYATITDAYLKNIEFEKKQRSKTASTLMKMFGTKINKETEDAVKSEKTFYPYICKRYFYLEKEPGKELLQLYMNASAHINEINTRLKRIEKEIQDIDARNKAEELQSRKPVLMYYQAMNTGARERIELFTALEIKQYALNSCFEKIGSAFSFGSVPYAYAWNPKRYEPKIPNDLANKFGDLPLPTFYEINDWYKKGKTRKFARFRVDYVKSKRIAEKISQRVNENHILNQKKELIDEALKVYSKGSKLMFINAVPTIIEGIFHDLCLLNGEDDNDLTRHGLMEKLKRLQKVMDHNLHYEYYAFRFRLLRNKIAHGRLKLDNVNEYADFMLLDLFDVTGMVFNENFNLNKKLSLIKQIDATTEDDKRNPLLLNFLLLNSITVPDFYNVSAKIIEVKEFMRDTKFWDYLEKQIERGGEAIHGILSILQILKPMGIDDRSCKRLLTKIGVVTLDQEQKELYFKYLI